MTKPVTTVAVMQLVEAGRVNPDTPADAYLPDLGSLQVLDDGTLRAPASIPTVRQLLSHTSGFAYEFLDPAIAALVEAGRLSGITAGGGAFIHAPLVVDPGSRWEYGIGLDWAGELVREVSGSSLDQYFRTEIFSRLGMNRTFYTVPANLDDRIAPHHARESDGSLAPAPYTLPPPEDYPSGGGGLYSTASDYIRFARMLLRSGELDGQRLLAAASVDEMARPQIGDMTLPAMLNPLPGHETYGLGVGLNRNALPSGRGAASMTWSGANNTFFWIDRANGICAVLMTNMDPWADPAVVALVTGFDRLVYQTFR
jgi:CubicO group peptidase (beta-lactamase class C family)